MVGYSEVWHGPSWRSMAGSVGIGTVGLGYARQAWLGAIGCGNMRQGLVRRGPSGLPVIKGR
jgi:hypothetical protein